MVIKEQNVNSFCGHSAGRKTKTGITNTTNAKKP